MNVRSIAQGSSEYNITVTVDAADTEAALNAAHARFFGAPTALALGLIGPGLIGGALLEQLREQVRLRCATLDSLLSLLYHGMVGPAGSVAKWSPVQPVYWLGLPQLLLPDLKLLSYPEPLRAGLDACGVHPPYMPLYRSGLSVRTGALTTGALRTGA